MKVINRSQITEVVTKRNVTHTVELNGKRYSRREKVKIYLPYMNCNPISEKPTVEWCEYVKPNVSGKLTNKEVKKLGLEDYFSKLDLNSLNGNNY